jgi:hypothetical protein
MANLAAKSEPGAEDIVLNCDHSPARLNSRREVKE